MTKEFFGQRAPKNTISYTVFQGGLYKGNQVDDADADRFARLVGAMLRSAVPECEVQVEVLRNVRAKRGVSALAFSEDVSPEARKRAEAAVSAPGNCMMSAATVPRDCERGRSGEPGRPFCSRIARNE
jgi:hypothetical protein